MGDRSNGCEDRLGQRVLSTLVLVPVALVVTVVEPGLFKLFVMVAFIVLTDEWSRMVCRHERERFAGLPLVLGGVLAMALLVDYGRPGTAVIVSLLSGLIGGLVVWGRDSVWYPLGAVYLTLPALASIAMHSGPHGTAYILWLFAVVWSTDTGAYLAGRLIGGPLVAPTFSPHKTWAGLMGGWSLGILAGLSAGLVLAPGAGVVNMVDLAALMGVSALVSGGTHLGDMTESALKRRFGIKDTGRLLPGHGGLLDRLDGYLIAVMILALCVALGWRL